MILCSMFCPYLVVGFIVIDCVRVVTHTANMIPGDWANMCQAVWRSPLLPLQKTDDRVEDLTLGSGARFKRDLLAYLTEYGPKKTGPLVEQLRKYDFGAIRAALVASVPSKQKIDDLDSQKKTLWGWPALKDIMRQIPPAQKTTKATTPHIVTQVCPTVSTYRIHCMLTRVDILRCYAWPDR